MSSKAQKLAGKVLREWRDELLSRHAEEAMRAALSRQKRADEKWVTFRVNAA